MTRRLGWLAALFAGCACIAVAVWLGLRTTYHTPPPTGEVPLTASTLPVVVPSIADSSAVSPSAEPSTPAPVPGLPPLRVQVPAVGIDGRVVPVAVSANGALGVPDDPKVLGWWQGGAAAGASSGTVVVDGHVDSARLGAGTLYPLERAEVGDEVLVTTASGVLHYTVAARRAYLKSDLPAEVFARDGRPRLVLITCGGPFDSRTGHYRNNVVVYAVPAA